MMLAAFEGELPRSPAPRPLPKLNKFIMPANSPAEGSVAGVGPGDRSDDACLADLGPVFGEETKLAAGAGDKDEAGKYALAPHRSSTTYVSGVGLLAASVVTDGVVVAAAAAPVLLLVMVLGVAELVVVVVAEEAAASPAGCCRRGDGGAVRTGTSPAARCLSTTPAPYGVSTYVPGGKRGPRSDRRRERYEAPGKKEM